MEEVRVRYQAVTLADPDVVIAGRGLPRRGTFWTLTFRGGLVLTSPYREFGGLSGLRVAADGAHFLAVTVDLNKHV